MTKIGTNQKLKVFSDGDSFVFMFTDVEGNVSCHSVSEEDVVALVERLNYMVGDCV